MGLTPSGRITITGNPNKRNVEDASPYAPST